MQLIKSRLRGIIQRQFSRCPVDNVPLDSELSWDSMEELEVEMLVEKEFGLRLQEGDLRGNQTLDDLTYFVVRKLSDGLSQVSD